MFKRIVLPILVSIFLFSCSKSGGGSSADNSSNVTANTSGGGGQNQLPTSEYLLVGASSAYNAQGVVLLCNLDGTNCIEFLGGNSTRLNAQALGLVNNDRFGTSMAINGAILYVSAASKDGGDGKSPGSGKIFRFDLTNAIAPTPNANASAATPSSITFTLTKDGVTPVANQYFGKSLFATPTALYVGSNLRKNSEVEQGRYSQLKTGSIFQCDLKGENCNEVIPGNSPLLANNSGISKTGISLFLNSTTLLFGASTDTHIGSYGRVVSCAIDLNSNCVDVPTSNLDLITNDNFGASIIATAQNLYVGAPGRDASDFDVGAIFICGITAANNKCAAFNTSKPKVAITKNDKFGFSLALSNDQNTLYVGSVGRKTSAKVTVGGVFKCNIDGTNCSEIIAGKSVSGSNATNNAAIKNVTTAKPGGSFDFGVSYYDNIAGPLIGASLLDVTIPVQSDVTPSATIPLPK